MFKLLRERPVSLVRFAAVGIAVAALYLLAYVWLLHIGVAQMVANAAAFLLAVIVQYIGQAGFTFRTRLADPGAIVRFTVMIGAGLLTAQLITGVVGPAMGLAAWQSALAVTFILPVQNFLVMTAWVFAPRYLTRPNPDTP